MPGITSALLSALADRFDPDAGRPVATRSNAYRGPPVLFPAHMLPALAGLDGDRGARHLLAEAAWVEAPAAAVADVDTPGDLRRTRQH
jgi:molybdenum cofactor cytidylyltransferase